jgi:hypothetical protein
MRASEYEPRENRIDVSRFAPPKYRMRAGAVSIGPALERLSRGVSDGDPESTTAQSVPPAEPIHLQDASPSLKIPLPMTGRLAAAIGLVVVLTAASVTFLQSNAKHPVSAASDDAAKTTDKTMKAAGIADMPRPVRTVTFRREPETVGDAQASAVVRQPAPPQAGASFTERLDALAGKPAEPHVDNAPALTAPLTLWAMFPGDPSADDEGTETASANAEEGEGAQGVASTQAAVRRQRAKAANEARRQRYTQGRRTRTAATKPQSDETAETQANAAQPTKKFPLQAAIDAIFGNGGGASGSRAPATTGAAFQ